MKHATAKRELAFMSSPHLILTCTSLFHFVLVLQHVVLDLIDTIKQYSATGYSTAQEVSSADSLPKSKFSPAHIINTVVLKQGLPPEMRLFRKNVSLTQTKPA